MSFRAFFTSRGECNEASFLSNADDSDNSSVCHKRSLFSVGILFMPLFYLFIQNLQQLNLHLQVKSKPKKDTILIKYLTPKRFLLIKTTAPHIKTNKNIILGWGFPFRV